MVRFFAIFSLVCASLYGDGMIISFEEETPACKQLIEAEPVVETPEAISRSPPRPDDLPVYPGDTHYDIDADSPSSSKGPNYFRKKKDKLEIISPENESHTHIEIDKSREVKRPSFRGRDKTDSTRSNYTDDYLEDNNSFDRPDSFFDRDSSDTDRFNPTTPSMGGYEKTIMHTALIVFGFILFLLLFVWILRKFSRGKVHSSAGREITVLERKHLSHKSTLYLVKVNNKKFLIAESQLEVKAMRPVNIELEED